MMWFNGTYKTLLDAVHRWSCSKI